MRYYYQFIFLILCLCLSSCNNFNVYKSPNYINYRHTKVAILPFTYELVTGFSKSNFDLKKLREREEAQAFEIQSYVFNEFLKLKASKEDMIEVQSIDETNRLLKEGGITPHDLRNVSFDKLAKELKVDEVIYGRIRDSRPVSDAENIARQLLYGSVAVKPSKIELAVSLYHNETESIMWRFDSFKSGSKQFKDKLRAMVYNLPYFSK